MRLIKGEINMYLIVEFADDECWPVKEDIFERTYEEVK